MSLQRRAGAPRLIEWTGERCVPWTPDVQVVYEHMHRYLWAAELLEGGRVLDIASGEGFGASILADRAREVIGIDLDERTVEHSQLSWSSAHVSFQTGDARDLSRFEDSSFDAVVAFELIEHLTEQKRVLEEAARVLKPDGLLIISTPDRRIYSEATGEENPFHELELSRDEFATLLAGEFSGVTVWGQRTITGSHIDLLEDNVAASPSSSEASYFIERAGDEWRIAGEPAGRYMVALASNAPLPALSRHSTLSDCGLELLRAAERRAAETTNSIVAERDVASREVNSAQKALGEQGRLHEEQLRASNEAIAQRDEYVRHRDAEVAATRAMMHAREVELDAVRQELAESRLFNRKVEESVTWQAFQRARGRLFGRLGEGSRGVRALRGTLRLAGRTMRSRAGATEAPSREDAVQPIVGETIRLPTFERPTVSLIIPAYSGSDLTRRCLESIRDNTDMVGYEVIVVDDASDQETKDLLTLVDGVQVVANQQNLGYLKSVNRGALVARGDWLCLCNNDIEVTPLWLQSMIDCAESRENVGIVAPKFVAPDGLLSEAGGIIWNDGSGVNYGRGERPEVCHYNFAREVDYGSAAALLVRAQLWQDIGGFDERYEPMYYEDVDLCFEARSRGWKVFYEPASLVVHAEGSTAGTDPSAGHKRHQEVNRVMFVEKWRDQLAAEYLQPGAPRVRAAATRHRGSQVLVVDFRVPMRDRDAGSLRMYEILRALQRQGFGVTFVPDNFLPLEPYTRELQRLGIEVIYGGVNLLAEFAEMGPRLRAAILSRPHSASRWLDSIREYAPNALVVYDTVDLHWVRESRSYALSRNGSVAACVERGVAGPKARALRELELAMVRASDITVTVTDDERTQILSEVDGASVAVIPTVHDVEARVAPVEGRNGLLFVGGFEHPPNADAAIYLVEEVMPRVWARIPDLMVTIVGSGAPAEVQELASSRVDVRGWVAELEPLFAQAEALVAPVRFGAGVKGKITQALAAGLPVVTSSIGAEGLGGVDGVDMLIGDTPDALAQRIVSLVEGQELWSRLSAGGQQLIAEKCSLQVLDERIRELLSEAVGEPSA